MKRAPRLMIAFVATVLAFNMGFLEAQSGDPIRLAKGTRLLLDLDTALNSATTREGDSVLLKTRNNVRIHDRIAIPRGAVIKATAIRVKPAFVNGKSKHAELHLKFEELLLSDGAGLRLETDILKLETEEIGQSTLQTTQAVVRQSLPNAVVGGLIAGRVGAVAGVLGGLGIGAVSAARRPKTAGTDVDIPQGSIIQMSLKRSLEIPNPTLFAGPASAALAKPPIDSPPSADTSNVGTPSIVASSATPASPAVAVPDFGSDNAPLPSAASAAPPSPASKTPGVFSLSVDVKLVQVDAIVHDRSGKPMIGLQKEDFRVFEDGVEQPLQHFSKDELPLAVALVIDRSGSVAPIMDRIQMAAFKALQHLKRGDQMALFSFAGNIELLEELTTDRQRVANRIGTIEPGGGTRIMDAIDEALNYLQFNARDRRRAVILISDNFEVDSRATPGTVVDRALKTEAVIYSVRIREGSSLPLLPGPVIPQVNASRASRPDPVVRLTSETGGEIFDARTSALDGALETAVTRLKVRYTLGYAPAARSSPGRYHTIEVRLADRFGQPATNYNILARRGYYE